MRLALLALVGFVAGGKVPDHSGPMTSKCQACCACVHYHKLKGAAPPPPTKSEYWKHSWLYTHGGEAFASQCHVEECADPSEYVSSTGVPPPKTYCWASDKFWVATHFDDKTMSWRKSTKWNSNCGEIVDPYICNTRKTCFFTVPTPAPTWAPTPPPTPFPTPAPSPTTAAPLHDEHPFCITLAATGDCTNNHKWMARNCAKTCHAVPTPAPLADKHTFCKTLAATGGCTSNRAWMLERCALSCDPAHGKMQDASSYCHELGSAGQCGTTKWMKMNCRATCHRLLRGAKRLALLHGAKRVPSATAPPAVGAPPAAGAPVLAPTLAPTRAPTRAPTPPVGKLVDLHVFCPSLKLAGHCASNKAWMQINCARSCDYAAAEKASIAAVTTQPPTIAPDKHTFCPLLSGQGHCLTNKKYMLANCAKSCAGKGVTV